MSRRARNLKRHVVSLALISAVGIATAVSGGCAEEEKGPFNYNPASGITLKENTVLAARAVTDDAVVEENSITFPKTSDNEAWAKRLKPGVSVIVGNRDSSRPLRESKNPMGFLRKVVEVGTRGDTIVIKTAPGKLRDAFTGPVPISGKESLFKDEPADAVWKQDNKKSQEVHALREQARGLQPQPRTIRPLNEQSADELPPSATADVNTQQEGLTTTEPGTSNADGGVTRNKRFTRTTSGGLSVAVENPSFEFNINASGDAPNCEWEGVQTSECCNFAFCMPCIRSLDDLNPVDCDANASFNMRVGATLEADLKLTAQVGTDLTPTKMEPALELVTVLIGLGPATFEITPSLGCAVSAQADISTHMRLHGSLGLEGAAGVGVENYVDSDATFQLDFTNTIASGEITAGCEVKGEARVALFGVAGVGAELSLGGNVKLSACTGEGEGNSDFAVSGEIAVRGKVSASIEIPVANTTLWEHEFWDGEIFSASWGDAAECRTCDAPKDGELVGSCEIVASPEQITTCRSSCPTVVQVPVVGTEIQLSPEQIEQCKKNCTQG